MIKILSLITLIALFSTCSQPEPDLYLFSYFINNGEDGLHLAWSEDGKKWTPLRNNQSFLTPTAGQDKLMRDPCIIRGGDGRFHMVWTVSWGERGIGYANSPDLMHWSEQQFIPVMKDEPTARNCWAPEIFYDDPSGRYMIYWATTLPGRFPKSDSTSEDGYDHRIYYTTTRDFAEFSPTQLLYDQGFSVIDATIQKTGDHYIMFLKNETLVPQPEKNIRMATSTELTGNYSPPTEPIMGNWVEGPTAIRAGNEWVVYFDRYRENKMGAVTSTDLKTWTDISDQLSFPADTRHGTIFKVKQSEFMKLK